LRFFAAPGREVLKRVREVLIGTAVVSIIAAKVLTGAAEV
jgi:hypothetical protein